MVGSIITRIGLLHYWSRFVARVDWKPKSGEVDTIPAIHTVAARLPGPHFATMDLESTAEFSGLSKTEAEDLLDWLEANGNPSWELVGIAASGFVVRRK